MWTQLYEKVRVLADEEEMQDNGENEDEKHQVENPEENAGRNIGTRVVVQ